MPFLRMCKCKGSSETVQMQGKKEGKDQEGIDTIKQHT